MDAASCGVEQGGTAGGAAGACALGTSFTVCVQVKNKTFIAIKKSNNFTEYIIMIISKILPQRPLWTGGRFLFNES